MLTLKIAFSAYTVMIILNLNKRFLILFYNKQVFCNPAGHLYKQPSLLFLTDFGDDIRVMKLRRGWKVTNATQKKHTENSIAMKNKITIERSDVSLNKVNLNFKWVAPYNFFKI